MHLVKSGAIARFITFISILSLLLTGIQFFTGYNPFDDIKAKFEPHGDSETEINNEDENEEKTQPPQVSDTTSSPIQVKIPDESNNSTQEEHTIETDNSIDSSYFNYVNTPVFLNVAETMGRDGEGIIHISWTPMFNQDIYKLTLKIDDPFSDIADIQEYFCKNSWCDIVLSECSSNTEIVVLVGVFDKDSSDWSYVERSFTLIK